MSNALLSLDESQHMALIKVVNPDVWKWIVSREQSQQQGDLAQGTPEGPNDGEQSLGQRAGEGSPVFYTMAAAGDTTTTFAAVVAGRLISDNGKHDRTKSAMADESGTDPRVPGSRGKGKGRKQNQRS